jgi:hypothetical protein
MMYPKQAFDEMDARLAATSAENVALRSEVERLTRCTSRLRQLVQAWAEACTDDKAIAALVAQATEPWHMTARMGETFVGERHNVAACGAPLVAGGDGEVCRACVEAIDRDQAAAVAGLKSILTALRLDEMATHADMIARIDQLSNEVINERSGRLEAERGAKSDIEATLNSVPARYVVRVREGGGPEDVSASLAVTVSKLVSLLEKKDGVR